MAKPKPTSDYVTASVHFTSRDDLAAVREAAEALNVSPSKFMAESAVLRAAQITRKRRCPTCGHQKEVR